MRKLRTARSYYDRQPGFKAVVPGSRTKQSFKEECDINTIVRRFGLTGQAPSGVRMPTYGDFTGLANFHEAVNAIALANEAFDQMPSAVRARFDNDPGKFVDFCNSQENREEAIKLGLVPPPAPVQEPVELPPQRVVIVDPGADPAPSKPPRGGKAQSAT